MSATQTLWPNVLRNRNSRPSTTPKRRSEQCGLRGTPSYTATNCRRSLDLHRRTTPWRRPTSPSRLRGLCSSHESVRTEVVVVQARYAMSMNLDAAHTLRCRAVVLKAAADQRSKIAHSREQAQSNATTQSDSVTLVKNCRRFWRHVSRMQRPHQ